MTTEREQKTAPADVPLKRHDDRNCPWYKLAQLGDAVVMQARADALVHYWLERVLPPPDRPPPLRLLGPSRRR